MQQVTTGGNDIQPTWSADGGQVGFTRFDGTDNEIHVIDIDGTNDTALTDNSANDDNPAWEGSSGPPCTITGTSGNDHLVGTAGDDVICGLDGNDTIMAGDGNDLVFGGDGIDLIKGEGGDDALLGEGDKDAIFGGAGADTLDGGDGNDVLHAKDGTSADVVEGGSGHNHCVVDGLDVMTDCGDSGHH